MGLKEGLGNLREIAAIMATEFRGGCSGVSPQIDPTNGRKFDFCLGPPPNKNYCKYQEGEYSLQEPGVPETPGDCPLDPKVWPLCGIDNYQRLGPFILWRKPRTSK